MEKKRKAEEKRGDRTKRKDAPPDLLADAAAAAKYLDLPDEVEPSKSN